MEERRLQVGGNSLCKGSLMGSTIEFMAVLIALAGGSVV